MNDRFSSFEMLKKEMREDVDFKIQHNNPHNSGVCVIAPHGGKIEKHTSDIARLVADSDHAYYCFEGLLLNNNRDLHITSHNFDEPRALELVKNVEFVLGVHGMRDRKDGIDVCLGGLDLQLIDCLEQELTAAGVGCLKSGHKFLAKNKKNICNRGRTGAGAQLELSRSFRENLFKLENDAKKIAFVEAVRKAIRQRLASAN